MSKKVIGIQMDAQFTIDGNQFKGLNLFLSYPWTGVSGERCEKVFVNETRPYYIDALNLNVGDCINLIYNRYGKLEGIIKDPS